MTFRELHVCWEWRLRSSPEALWPLVSDTNRFNRDAGLPAVERVRDASAGAIPGRPRLRMRAAGMTVEWDEDPFEWVRPRHFSVCRRYHRGPLAEMRVRVELHSEGSGTRLVYQVWARPSSLLGRLLAPSRLNALGRRFGGIFRAYDDQASPSSSSSSSPGAAARLAPGGRERLSTAAEALRREGCSADLVGRLTDAIDGGDDASAARLRPFVLADGWGVARRDVLALCLRATRAGLLDFRWDHLCTACRGAQHSPSTLLDARGRVHCESCGIDSPVRFDEGLELTFRPNPAVRILDVAEYCIGGPRVTPHVLARAVVPPGAETSLAPVLDPGAYRLRIGSGPLTADFDSTEEGAADVRLRFEPVAGAPPDTPPRFTPAPPARLGTRPRMTVLNATDRERTVSIERRRDPDAVTAAQAASLQMFRDLFAREALRPGTEIAVGRLTLVFTDLRGSTRLYREVGDATAFGWVMSHFDVLREAIATEGGAIVKTIGDAVMATFTRPLSAVRAVLEAQRRLASPPPGGPLPLRLKAGIHCGPCIAVTLNERLDYFGTAVNVAARLVDLSDGTDLVVSASVREDPEIARRIDENHAEWRARPFTAALKGFDREEFRIFRLAAGAGEPTDARDGP